MPGRIRSAAAFKRNLERVKATLKRTQVRHKRALRALQFARFPFTKRAPNGHRELSSLLRILLIAQAQGLSLPTPNALSALIGSLNANCIVRKGAGHDSTGPGSGFLVVDGIETEAKTRE